MEACWIIMPVVTGWEMTQAAISDCLGQSVPTRVLVIGQGCDTELRQNLERAAEFQEERLLCWFHDPPLPSLAATWNRALHFCWETGATNALVINNDVRLHRMTAETLQHVRETTAALFVSAVGVTEAQFDLAYDPMKLCTCQEKDHSWYHCASTWPKGGPDFSCFLISKEAHEKYPFDEGFIPAYCEDLDTHRRYMLGGDGDKIFSVNLPYLHYASGTLKSMDPPDRQRRERAIDGSRTYYAKKWGGPVNQERFTIPFDESSATDGVTTPELQHGQTSRSGGASLNINADVYTDHTAL